MCTDVKLSYSAFPAGPIFRLGISILVLTLNTVLMRVAATFALVSTQESQAYCKDHPTACSVTAFSVLGSMLPILMAVSTGSFAIVAAKKFFKWAFITTFAFGCVLMTASFLLNLLFNGLRHRFNIAPVLVPDILEVIMFCIISLLSMMTGILCVQSLVRDRSERYAVRAGEAAGSSQQVAVNEYELEEVHQTADEEGIEYDNATIAEESEDLEAPDGSTSNNNNVDHHLSNSLRPPGPPVNGELRSSSSSRRRKNRKLRPARTGSSLSSRDATDARVEASELRVGVENENGKVTNFDIFTIGSK